MNLLIHIISVGFAAAGFAALVKALPWPKSWASRKPLSCNICMGGHGAWIALVADVVLSHTMPFHDVVLIYFGATAVAASVCTFLFPPAINFGEPS